MTLKPAKDFFISYNQADRAWAEWIAWMLEEAGITVELQAWDFRPGANFVLLMHEAIRMSKRVIAVLSPAYLADAPYSAAEWAAAFVQDPTGTSKTLLPVRVQPCNPTGLLASVVYIDIVGCDEVSAAGKLLAGIDAKRAKPSTAPDYPGKVSPVVGPGYPANWPDAWTVPYARNPFFSGRDELLKHLHERLTTTKATALTQAISGLGGIVRREVV